MKWPVLALAAFTIIPGALSQDSRSTIRVDVINSFVWGEDAPSGAISSTIGDPVTGYSLHRLRYGEIEVTSRIGFEGIGANKTGTLVSYVTTIANSAESPVSVRFGGFIIEGRMVSPLKLVQQDKKDHKRAAKPKPDVMDLDKMHCFTSGFLPGDKFFWGDTSSQMLSVAPQTSLIVSTIVRDPRGYGSILCSPAGCYPTGTIRYALNVDGREYVFVWPGRSAVYCGK